MFKTNLFLKSVQYYICNNWKKFLGPWKSINSKMTEKFKKKKKSIANFNEMLLKIVILKTSESFLCI